MQMHRRGLAYTLPRDRRSGTTACASARSRGATMSWQAWLTLGVVVVAIAALASERVSQPGTVMAAVTVLLLTRVIDAKSALSRFSHEAPFTIAALHVAAG